MPALLRVPKLQPDVIPLKERRHVLHHVHVVSPRLRLASEPHGVRALDLAAAVSVDQRRETQATLRVQIGELSWQGGRKQIMRGLYQSTSVGTSVGTNISVVCRDFRGFLAAR